MVLRCKSEKIEARGFRDGVGECMEGQIGGKSGPGVLRTRQSGDLGAWGEAWKGLGVARIAYLGGPVGSGSDLGATLLARFF